MASNQLNTIHSHSKPDEVSNQSLPEHEDVMDHESSPEKDDDPAAQAPALPVMPGPSVNKKVPKVSSSEDYSCGINCGGKFLYVFYDQYRSYLLIIGSQARYIC
jgi:hypothetical protein